MAKKLAEKFYVVCCKDLHTSIGPLYGLKAAFEVADAAMKQEGNTCVFVPVELQLLGQIMEMPSKGSPSAPTTQVESKPGELIRGYL